MQHWLVALLLGPGWPGAGPLPVEPLALDFTFPTASVIENVGVLKGIAAQPDGDAVVLLNNTQELLFFTLDGELRDRRTLTGTFNLHGIDWLPGDDLLLSSRSGRLLQYRPASDVLTPAGRLPRWRGIEAVAYSDDGTTYAISNRRWKRLLRLHADGNRSAVSLDLRLSRFRFTGLDIVGDHLYAAAIDALRRPEQPALVVQLTTDGQLQQAWSIDGKPSGLAVLDESPRGPTLLTSNRDADASIRLYEPPPLPGELDEPPLSYLAQFELNTVPQPSGVAYSRYDSRLYYVTDFGRVASSRVDGSGVEILFDLSDTLQGTYEAIAVGAAGELYLLASDAGEPARLLQFDATGTLLADQLLISDESAGDSVIEGFSLAPLSQQRWWVNAAAGEPKTLSCETTDGTIKTLLLPDDYTPLTITGLEVVEDIALLVTDQRIDDDQTLAGLALLWDVAEGDEIARFSIAVPTQNGELRGVISPSGVAINPASGILYVTSDTDAGTVYGYELPIDDDRDDDLDDDLDHD